MNRRKKEITRIFFAVIFVITIFLSNVQILSNFNILQDEKNKNTFNEGVLDEFPLSSDLNLDDYITGSGVDQDVRIYVNNISKNLNDNQEYFEIPSIPSRDMFLTYGDFNFTFQNNFTTEYIIEDDDALNVQNFISYDYNTSTSYSNITFNKGTGDPLEFNRLYDNNNDTSINVNSDAGVINFTIAANFFGTRSSPENLEFNRSNILGLFPSLDFYINQNVNLTIRIQNATDSTWITVANLISINSSLDTQDIQRIKNRLINTNLNHIDSLESCYIQYIFNKSDLGAFNLKLHEFDFQSTYAFDLPITDTKYVALEFDLKGLNSTVNGFYVWIRTLDLQEAATSQLNITLYRANRTVVRNDVNLRSIHLGPDYNELFDSNLVDYTGDSLSYFEFDISKTDNLNLSNYFIVIKSTNSKAVYSLVTLPWAEYGDNLETEHQLKMTDDDGNNWINAYKTPSSYQLDASSFKLNVTRGYKPSDFIINNTETLKIQDLPITDMTNKSYPYNVSSYLEWGIGRWNRNFTTPIEDIIDKFQIDLTWDKSITNGFEFNVSYYSANAYWVEDATANYRATYSENPEWAFNYYLDKTDSKFTNWKFVEFWYVYPNFMSAHNLTNPSPDEIFYQTGGELILEDNPTKFRVVVHKNIANPDGFFTLNLTSFNFIHDMHSYINYKGEFWETNGFMYGDNITVGVDIQDHNSKAPINGNASVTLYYPNGTTFSNLSPDLVGNVVGSSLVFDFDNETILELTNDVKVFGEYNLGFFWFNGSAIGCKKIITYIDTYNVELHGCNYNPTLKKNMVVGHVQKVYPDFTLLIASVNHTKRPDFYPINNTNVNTQFSYEIEEEQLPILLSSFKQSENILNPSETVNIKALFENLHQIQNISVKINVKLVSYANEEWIIAENTSSTIDLKFSGHPDDNKEFDVNLKIPDLNNVTHIWTGVNAPIRLAGAKTQITVFIENINVGMYESAELSLFSNETNNKYDGHILGLRINKTTSPAILNEFDRDECIYLPNKTSFLVNIFDQNYVSSYKQFTGEFSLKLNSKFTDISIDPITPIKGQSFNISTILATEFGEPLVNKNVSCHYYDIDSWVTLSSDYTDLDGSTTFLINTLTIDFEGDLLLKLAWEGDTINGVSENITINVIHEINNISISIIANDVLIYQNRNTTLMIILNNIGDSNLRVTNISINLNHDLSYSIVEIDYLILNQLAPDESTNLIIEVAVGDINRIEISISITALNIITNENITVPQEASFNVYDPPIQDYFIEYFIFIMGAVIALAWLIAIIYYRRTKKKLETPIEIPVKKKPRRAKYVPVAELKKPTPVKKIPKKKEEPKEIEEKKKMDLDSLLEERGLADKKKKPKE